MRKIPEIRGAKTRNLVYPGDLTSERSKPLRSLWTYAVGRKRYSGVVGIPQKDGDVIPLKGKYIPKVNDLIIGIISDVQPVYWLVDIYSPYSGVLHANETNWEIKFGETAKYLEVEDAIIAKIQAVDETKRVFITMKDPRARKITSGALFFFPASKVARIVGKGGSMISMLKQKTKCSIVVGQNGVVWVDGEPEMMLVVGQALEMISRYSHVIGLTALVSEFIDKKVSEMRRRMRR